MSQSVFKNLRQISKRLLSWPKNLWIWLQKRMRIPIELLLNLSKFLNIRDRIRLRCVCKEWRSFIDEFCLDELVLFIRVHPTLELWSHNSKAIEFRNLIFSQSDRWHSDANGFKFVFRNVKRLFLCIRNQEDAAYRLGEIVDWKNINLKFKIRIQLLD